MKLSIWQQFSSNHSANFMIVGQFESVEWAETIADELKAMIQEISDWWKPYESWEETVRVEAEIKQQGGLTPPEKKFFEQYKLQKWGTSPRGVLEWVQAEHAADAVRTLRNLVIINQSAALTGETWAGPTPFDDILRILGAKVAVDCENWDTYLAMNLRCNAANEEAAQAIIAQAKTKDYPDIQEIELPGLRLTRGKISRDEATIIIEGYQFRYSYYRHVPPEKRPKSKRKRLSDTWIKWPFEEEFQRLLDYLTAQGCTEMSYEFVELPYP